MRKMPEKYADLTGGLSWPSKMPCPSWSISAKLCNTGGRLRSNPQSVCAKCYAMKGRYVFSNVEKAMDRRFNAYLAGPQWTAGMVLELDQLAKRGLTHFRWFDSGDLFSGSMLREIVKIAEGVPYIQFWLPTKEYRLLQDFASANRGETCPKNLRVRVSLPLVYDSHRGAQKTHGLMVLTERKDTLAYFGKQLTFGATVRQGWTCPSHDQGNQCLDCRKCWSPRPLLSYRLH